MPIVYVIDPRGDVVASLFGSASVAELESFLDDAAKPVAMGSPEEALRHGDARMEASDAIAAAAAYRKAIDLGGEAWPKRAHAFEQLVTALAVSDPAACVKLADETAPSMARARPFVTVVLTGLVCSLDDSSNATPAAKGRLEALANEALAQGAAEEDDRYQLWDALVATRKKGGDDGGAKRYAQAYLAYVESMPLSDDEEVRGARDLSRLRAAVTLGDTSRVIPALEASEKALARSYAASLRLGSAYLRANRPADALAAAARGLSRSPGPVGIARLLSLRAAAEVATGATADAQQDLRAARDAAEKIPDRKLRKQTLANIETVLAHAAGGHG